MGWVLQMSVEYGAYLVVILVGALALQSYWKTGFLTQFNRLVQTLVVTAFFFVVWDVLAVAAGHWWFDSRFITGFFVFNQPIEEIAFFFVVPFFYVTVWEYAKRVKK